MSEHLTPVRVWKMLLKCDDLTDSEFEKWIEEMYRALQKEKAEQTKHVREELQRSLLPCEPAENSTDKELG